MPFASSSRRRYWKNTDGLGSRGAKGVSRSWGRSRRRTVHALLMDAPPLDERVNEDPDDEMFLAAALAAKARLIVSGDKHLRRVSGWRGIDVLKARPFVDRYIEPADIKRNVAAGSVLRCAARGCRTGACRPSGRTLVDAPLQSAEHYAGHAHIRRARNVCFAYHRSCWAIDNGVSRAFGSVVRCRWRSHFLRALGIRCSRSTYRLASHSLRRASKGISHAFGLATGGHEQRFVVTTDVHKGRSFRR